MPAIPPVASEEGSKMDVIETSGGSLEVTCVGHGTLVFSYQGRTIHVDPWSQLSDYSKMPKADLVLITHEHRDHLDAAAVEAVRKEDTLVVANAAAAGQVPGSEIMGNGDVKTLEGLRVEAVPAYNLVHMRGEGEPFHPRGSGNGYVVTFGDKRVYVAGDTENIPEMKDLAGIDCAFLPMNLPYTMTPEMVADAARTLNPGILYPYHYGETDPALLESLLEGSGIEVRIRDMR
jgi:L-ascorbate metabolism protein UlaG (beta-lactamase superfamily)